MTAHTGDERCADEECGMPRMHPVHRWLDEAGAGQHPFVPARVPSTPEPTPPMVRFDMVTCGACQFDNLLGCAECVHCGAALIAASPVSEPVTQCLATTPWRRRRVRCVLKAGHEGQHEYDTRPLHAAARREEPAAPPTHIRLLPETDTDVATQLHRLANDLGSDGEWGEDAALLHHAATRLLALSNESNRTLDYTAGLEPIGTRTRPASTPVRPEPDVSPMRGYRCANRRWNGYALDGPCKFAPCGCDPDYPSLIPVRPAQQESIGEIFARIDPRKPPEPVTRSPVSPKRNSCNKHDDCAAADASKTGGAIHCHDDECEECFGC